ncbi:3-coathanger stack domain-containing protein [Runella aurantiaca]|uniref:Ig-like domain-containing protein n=1 Tax=Runella aurantiaca TaxID=2282308 RepID=A0A369II92_9BACT|nr:3-coathanger stack domain-containing protein [Runella aurantiaca]RDB06974.1 hypothetical protein DVG78_06780 [Runella aurantiaca]
MKSPVIGSGLIFVGIVLFYATGAFAQTSFKLRLVPKVIACDSAIVSVEIQAPDSAFVMGNANLRIFYKSAQLANPSIKSRNNFSSGDYFSITSLTDVGADTSVFTLNILYRGEQGSGTTVGASWISVADVKFALTETNTSKCYDLFFLPIGASRSLPNTVITRAYASPTVEEPGRTLTEEVNGTFTNITNQCSLPIVAIAKAPTINAGEMAILTLSSQNGVFPATGTITGEAPIQLTRAEPIKMVSGRNSGGKGWSISGDTQNCTISNVITITPETPAICPGTSITMSASGCTGTLTWLGGPSPQTGSSVSFSPAVTTSYSANCSTGGSGTFTIVVATNTVAVGYDVITGKERFKAVTTLTSDKKVGHVTFSPSANVVYEAGNAITLLPGFAAEKSSTFQAEIKTCP